MDAFSALADPTRRRIVELLASRGRLTASEIAGQFQVSAPAISQHLKVLREAELVLVEKRAQQRIYRLNPAAMLGMELWAREIRERWDERFDALDRCWS
jgi:DNA-binding transcriptional ArsR family regulator